MRSISTLTNRFFGVPAVDLKHYPINAHFSEAADFIDSVIKGKGSYHSAPSEDAHLSCERERFLIDRELMSKLPLSNSLLRRRPSVARQLRMCSGALRPGNKVHANTLALWLSTRVNDLLCMNRVASLGKIQ